MVDITALTTRIDLNQLLLKIIFAVALFTVGLILGKVVGYVLRKIASKLELNKKIRGSFIGLFVFVIEWSIYITFLVIALNQLEIPTITYFITSILIVIPAFTGSLILIVVGYALAFYLKEVIKSSEVKGWQLISKIIFYFVLYVFGIYALKTALISFDEQTTNILIIILTAIISAAAGWIFVKEHLRRD